MVSVATGVMSTRNSTRATPWSSAADGRSSTGPRRTVPVGGRVERDGRGDDVGRRAVARARPGVRERAAGLGEERPVVGALPEPELQDPEGVVVRHLARRLRPAQVGVAVAARPDDELADAVERVGVAARRLRHVAVVDVVVPGEDHLGSVLEERLPEGLGLLELREAAGAEARVVEVGERAVGPARREVLAQPECPGASRCSRRRTRSSSSGRPRARSRGRSCSTRARGRPPRPRSS